MSIDSPAIDTMSELPAPAAVAKERVRLVVWDLDETFWRGTLSEGGVTEYVQRNHDIVVELAQRGILSSICSKNDHAAAMSVLEARGIAEYFVFPSVAWSPKGARLQQIVEQSQLRPETVMFIDDNFSQRAEAAALIPGLQIESDEFIAGMLDDPRFSGKDDRQLSRLAQYKLLERRHADALTAEGDNKAFLRSCDIRLELIYDFDDEINLDRAVELINRTNQLNFTKRRLPEDPRVARLELQREMGSFHRQAGLVRVVDRYGDYGCVGFFMLEADVFRPVSAESQFSDFRALKHFCFSCRTLGMLVEKWVYDYLGRPPIKVVGETLTDLSQDVDVDWVRLVSSMADMSDADVVKAPAIRLFGGCEMQPLSVYLTSSAEAVATHGNFSANAVFHRINSSALALSFCDRGGPEFAAEAARLGLPADLLCGDVFADAPVGSVFVFSTALDIQRRPHYRHRRTGWEFVFEIAGAETENVVEAAREVIEAKLSARFPNDAARVHDLTAFVDHIRENYECTAGISDGEREDTLRRLIERTPSGSKCLILLDSPRRRAPEGGIRIDPPTEYYNQLVQSLVERYDFASTLNFDDFITSDSEIQAGGNHYDRKVYLRVSQALIAAAEALGARA